MTDTQITPEDIESKFRDVADQVGDVAGNSKKKALLSGGILGFAILLIAFLLGKRSGKKKSSVVEIRRM